MMNPVDLIGDIHGHATELKRLLISMGYERAGLGFRHPDRKVVFLGDFVDRGPEIAEVITIARAMVDAGDAFAVMGNHEYNAIAFHTSLPNKPNQWFREHSDQNRKQHQATLDQLSPGELKDAIAWFQTLPVTLERDGFRVVHAAWRDQPISVIDRALQSRGRFTPEFLAESERPGSELHAAIEEVLKGPELKLPAGHKIVDKAGHSRDTVRVKWYEPPNGRTYRDYHFGSDDVPDLAIDPVLLTGMTGYPAEAPPVFVGHYWLTGTPLPLAGNVACTDYSVAKGGKLVAYQWDGEPTLSADKFQWTENGCDAPSP
ncbi:Diadenosine tetraphosphatase [Rhodopirellula islandica]|uniref:Diadenosine tetraphosphatase n=1 Tax=Rhodopirellula islandica TaxID=595434 RepID=A0A0J1BK30_RHOIS|nr:metallophosphoesterase [Rhodopirellula islandica]KLU06783.1 Diadenosine tetraphosphatase [Rhodopirellula islandica]